MQGCSRSFLLRTRVDLTDVTFHSCKFPSPQQKTNKNCPEILQRNTKLSMSQPAPRTSFCCGRIFANWALTKGRFALTSSDFHGFFLPWKPMMEHTVDADAAFAGEYASQRVLRISWHQTQAYYSVSSYAVSRLHQTASRG